MKKIYLLFVAAGLAACSTESVETEGIDSLDASVTGKTKAPVQDVQESFIVPDQICAGEETVFTFNFPDKPGKITLKVQLFGDDPATEEVEEWYNIYNEQFDGAGPQNFYYTFEKAGDMDIRYQIGGGGWTEVSIIVENCGCEESFTYVDNGDMTYTFIYTPEEDMLNAEMIFTFAQSVDVSGFSSGWEWHGQTMQTKMDLMACTSYSWDLTLIKKCGGNTPNNNVWTDFKVNDLSKKNKNTPTISKSCSE